MAHYDGGLSQRFAGPDDGGLEGPWYDGREHSPEVARAIIKSYAQSLFDTQQWGLLFHLSEDWSLPTHRLQPWTGGLPSTHHALLDSFPPKRYRDDAVDNDSRAATGDFGFLDESGDDNEGGTGGAPSHNNSASASASGLDGIASFIQENTDAYAQVYGEGYQGLFGLQ